MSKIYNVDVESSSHRKFGSRECNGESTNSPSFSYSLEDAKAHLDSTRSKIVVMRRHLNELGKSLFKADEMMYRLQKQMRGFMKQSRECEELRQTVAKESNSLERFHTNDVMLQVPEMLSELTTLIDEKRDKQISSFIQMLKEESNTVLQNNSLQLEKITKRFEEDVALRELISTVEQNSINYQKVQESIDLISSICDEQRKTRVPQFQSKISSYSSSNVPTSSSSHHIFDRDFKSSTNVFSSYSYDGFNREEKDILEANNLYSSSRELRTDKMISEMNEQEAAEQSYFYSEEPGTYVMNNEATTLPEDLINEEEEEEEEEKNRSKKRKKRSEDDSEESEWLETTDKASRRKSPGKANTRATKKIPLEGGVKKPPVTAKTTRSSEKKENDVIVLD